MVQGTQHKTKDPGSDKNKNRTHNIGKDFLIKTTRAIRPTINK